MKSYKKILKPVKQMPRGSLSINKQRGRKLHMFGTSDFFSLEGQLLIATVGIAP